MNALRAVALAILVVAGLAASSPAPTAADHNAAGVEAYNAKRWDEAVAQFSAAYQLEPTNKTVRLNLCNALRASADLLASKADFRAAAELLEQAIGVAPDNPWPLVQLASYYLRLNMVSDAIFRLKEALELDPKLVDAHDLLGDSYYRDNNLAGALDEWEWVYQAKPDRPGLKEKLEKAYREDSVEARFGRSGSRHFHISYAPGITRDEQNRVLTHLERAFIDIGQKFGGVYPPSPINVIIHTAKDFAASTQVGEHVGALYDGKIRVPLKDAHGQVLEEAELKRRLYHEYVHVVIRFLVNDNIPWWLNEGLAETFSREAADDDADLLMRAQKEKGLFSLAALEGDQLTALSPEQLRLAYAQGYVTAKVLWSRFGPNALINLMNALAEGTHPEVALQQCYRRNYTLLEREVGAYIAKMK